MSPALARMAMSTLALFSGSIDVSEAYKYSWLPSKSGDTMQNPEARAPEHRLGLGSATGAAPPSFAEVTGARDGGGLKNSTTEKPHRRGKGALKQHIKFSGLFIETEADAVPDAEETLEGNTAEKDKHVKQVEGE
uniref:Uncharacterized protein n=1 Tax=Zooxanthella nutricula TaxID=1333877 RepID=A0A6U6L7S2_9DINO|mmetsp:Transcript_3063/g.9303  ORF Transcript_3063/g.9303 Transcript_3063/m.9303 type:complete len:135 (+) Transcript_3063:64-468(+)|eukprot:CAMPEP_0198518678 /NCGR_PEP_ID=MMETSP1462-20131121/19258_1 /TAXON_ID=1333877 /ORGANISM="Brandtodinium nutriculum, Strain RCC3387" /LENGTH=134 /DNA_ID=CAMNT_0044248271 /DNA_START=64 /DNA_END=468 /DNA_ORIENTATION=-